MAVSFSSWKELTSILDADKKLLKKPNLPLMINQLNSLSLRMQDEELPSHAVICLVEAAHLYRRLGNSNEERKQYATAAGLLTEAFEAAKDSRSRIHCSYPNEIADLYSKSVKLCLEMKAFRMAGLTSLEAAKFLIDSEQYEMAKEHAQKAVRLLEGDFFAYTRALYFLAEIHFHLSQWENVLADIDDLWMNVMKTRSKNVAGGRMLRDLEVITVLVLQKCRFTPNGRHKILKELYENDENGGPQKSSLKSAIMDDSSLPLQEFAMFKKFLQLVSTGRNYEARGLLFGDESTPAGEGTSGRMQPRLPFLSPLAMQVLGRFLDERQDDYGY